MSTYRYSTLDREMIAKLDAKKRIQQRFNPPAAGLFDKDSYANANGRPQKGASTSGVESSSSINSSAFPGPIFPGIYEYSPMGPVLDDEPPMSKPIISKYPPAPMDDKVCKYFIINFSVDRIGYSSYCLSFFSNTRLSHSNLIA